MDLVQAVRADHVVLRQAFEQADAAAQDLPRLAMLLVSHECAEALVLYPAVRRYCESKVAARSVCRPGGRLDALLERCLVAVASGVLGPDVSELREATAAHVRLQSSLLGELAKAVPVGPSRMLGGRFARIRHATSDLAPSQNLSLAMQQAQRLAHRSLAPNGPHPPVASTPCDAVA